MSPLREDAPVRLSPQEETTLLELARRSLDAQVRVGLRPDSLRGGGLDRSCGAFVSIHAGTALRGCLGRIRGTDPLASAIIDLASAVADGDPRFPPVIPDELEALAIEISVLGAPRPIVSPGEIEIGTHGLLIEADGGRGLLLPQVAPRFGWSAERFVEQACVKAGLDAGAWRRQDATVFVFEAQVFGEAEPGSGQS